MQYGYTRENSMDRLDDEILRFIYISAMRDAVLQLSYKGKKKWLEDLDAFGALKGALAALTGKVLAGAYLCQEDYDADFRSTSIAVCEIINARAGNSEFTFGNSQKLINIMLKYFYIASYGDPVAKEKFWFCHCPMDQRMLKKVWDSRQTLNCEIELGGCADFMKSWGNEDFELNRGEKCFPRRYATFQRAVRAIAQQQGMSPLEYDYCEW